MEQVLFHSSHGDDFDAIDVAIRIEMLLSGPAYADNADFERGDLELF
jgi:hypothetical protein